VFLQIFGVCLKLEETTKQGKKIQSTCALTLLRIFLYNQNRKILPFSERRMIL